MSSEFKLRNLTSFSKSWHLRIKQNYAISKMSSVTKTVLPVVIRSTHLLTPHRLSAWRVLLCASVQRGDFTSIQHWRTNYRQMQCEKDKLVTSRPQTNTCCVYWEVNMSYQGFDTGWNNVALLESSVAQRHSAWDTRWAKPQSFCLTWLVVLDTKKTGCTVADKLKHSMERISKGISCSWWQQSNG